MATRHNRAVKKIAKEYKRQQNTSEVYADHIRGFPDPIIRVGVDNHIPDIFIKFTNGREKLIEVDSGTEMSADEREQHTAFERSARSKPNVRSYEHVFAHEVTVF